MGCWGVGRRGVKGGGRGVMDGGGREGGWWVVINKWVGG